MPTTLSAASLENPTTMVPEQSWNLNLKKKECVSGTSFLHLLHSKPVNFHASTFEKQTGQD
jgi:hypothetical protein